MSQFREKCCRNGQMNILGHLGLLACFRAGESFPKKIGSVNSEYLCSLRNVPVPGTFGDLLFLQWLCSLVTVEPYPLKKGTKDLF